MTYYIPEGNIGQFEKRIAPLIKRAAKLKSVLTYKIDRNDFRDVKVMFDRGGKQEEVWVRHFNVTVTGEEPKYAGWRFIGTLEHTDEGNVLRMVPNIEAPAQYRDCAPFCEHCKLNRVRKDTYLVRHDNGNTTQVGSNCLADFLGHENPHLIAKLAEIWVNLNELTTLAVGPHWVSGGGGDYVSRDRQDLMQFLSIVAEIVIRENQFWSRSAVERIRAKQGGKGGPEITAWRAARYMNPDRHDYNEAQEFTPTESAIELAEQAVAWVLREYGTPLPEDGTYDDIKAALLHTERTNLSDFEHNLLVVAKGQFCERRTFGIAAYIIEAYRKAHGMIPERKAKAVRRNEHFGTVGQRFPKLEVLIEKVFTWHSEEYGDGVLFKMITPEGNVAVWRTYNVSQENDMAEGQHYVVAATVKKHGDYNGEKQTEMSRVKVKPAPVKAPPAPAPVVEQPESLEPGDDFVPTTLQLVTA